MKAIRPERLDEFVIFSERHAGIELGHSPRGQAVQCSVNRLDLAEVTESSCARSDRYSTTVNPIG